MPPTFFVDENDIALGRRLETAYPGEVVFPGHADLPEVPRQTLDDDWLRVVGTRRLVVITRDNRIRYRPVQRAAWVSHAVRGFVLTGSASQSTVQSLTILNALWTRIALLMEERPEGPWMYAVTTGALREITPD